MEAKKILVIDDEEDIRTAVRDYLEEKGYAVVTAENGKSGLAAMTREKPDLVILDVELPDVPGYEVCKQIRSRPEISHTPVIMLTAHALEKEEISGFMSGADDYVAKPFKPARLLARITTAISRNMRELDANALTHLPGNMAIMREIQTRITSHQPFSALYFDLNNFKAFNDRYGFVKGDQAITLTSQILTRAFAQWKHQGGFLGHIGGDDFIGLIDSTDARPLCESIIRAFDGGIPDLYDEADRTRGWIAATDRRGNGVKVPIMGIAIAVVTNRQRNIQHPGEVAVVAGELKKWVKSQSGSAYVIDRRT